MPKMMASYHFNHLKLNFALKKQRPNLPNVAFYFLSRSKKPLLL